MSWFKSQAGGGIMGTDESLQFQNSSDIAQSITVGAVDTTVTLNNPHTVENGESSAKTIYVKLANDSVFAKYHFLAGQVKYMRPSSIGGSTTGTTADTVIVRGVK